MVEIVAPIVPVLARALQPRTEVVLHDLTRMPNTIAAISGNITGREIGGPPTDLGLRVFRSGHPEDMVNYRTETADGLALVPTHLMKKSHKVEVVRDLDQRGFFAIREAVDVIAQRLGVTKYTIYNYLNEISAAHQQPNAGTGGGR